jgi:acetyl esterase/lipase
MKIITTVLLVGVALTGTANAADVAVPPANTGFVDDQGATHVTRVVPVPDTISPEARATLTSPPPSILSSGATVADQRRLIGERQQRDAAECLKKYPAKVEDASIAGVPVRIVTPIEADPKHADWVLINVHGGAFRVDTGSLLESIPMASLARVKVVSVLYRLAPEHKFPEAVDDVIAVYRELLKDHSPAKIGIFGTSAGAIVTGEVAVKLSQAGVPLPAALGIFSGSGDFSRVGDSMALFSLQGLTGKVLPRPSSGQPSEYAGAANLKDPVLSPVFADLRGMPPTLFISSTRDLLLSGTVNLHRAFLEAGVDAQLVVFDALPHAFWLDEKLPESQEADGLMVRFFTSHLEK